MVDNNVNSVTPNYYRQSVIKSAIETGIIGAGVGATGSVLRSRKTLKTFLNKTMKTDEFRKSALKEKQAAITNAKALRDNIKKFALNDAGKTAAWAAGIGALMAIGSNILAKSMAKKQAAATEQVQ